MELEVIGTGSSGNTYVLHNQKTALIIEAGMPYKKALKAVEFDRKKIKGVLVSHSHGDHCSHIRTYTVAGIKAYMHKVTAKEINSTSPMIKTVEENKQFEIDDFVITPFKLVHDVFCLGFEIYHSSTGKIVFITDTVDSSYKHKDVSTWIIECNYSEEIITRRLIDAQLPSSLFDRIREGHLSLEKLKGIMTENDLTHTNQIIMIHGSDTNSDSEHFKKEIEQHTGKKVIVAENGLKLNINQKPY